MSELMQVPSSHGSVWKWPTDRDWSGHAYLAKFISTVICTGTGLPSFFAGLKRQVLTVSTALFSKTGAELRTTCTGPTCPRVSTPISITTTPRGSVSGGRSGYAGSGECVALGGVMPGGDALVAGEGLVVGSGGAGNFR